MSGETAHASIRVVEAVAAEKDISPLELTPLLHDVLNPDVLDRLVASGDDDLQVTVEYAGVRVTITGSGEVATTTPITPTPEATDAGEESSGVASD